METQIEVVVLCFNWLQPSQTVANSLKKRVIDFTFIPNKRIFELIGYYVLLQPLQMFVNNWLLLFS